MTKPDTSTMTPLPVLRWRSSTVSAVLDPAVSATA
jgi:hypothetical protein